ncbi:MAG: PAS domain S-box protein [Desulfobulbus sp.]|nr:PAS domain S-box protein [Desulfobulbus sp.]
MTAATRILSTPVEQELKDLFYQRTRICLWLGAVFFSFFALLDFVHARAFFSLFLAYRLSFVLILIGLLQLLRYPEVKRYSREVMFVAILLGTLVISLMTVKLGGFGSGYYVGILLMIAGGFSVLPLNIAQSLGLGVAMYLIYATTVYLGSRPLDGEAMNYFINNSFFFLSIVLVTTVQCFDEIQTLLNSLRAQKSLKTINTELKHYTGNLESLVKQRMAQLEESDLKFRDLYNNILDLVILIDPRGIIQMINHHGAQLLELSAQALKNRPLADFLPPQDRDFLNQEILRCLAMGEQIRNIQMQMLTYRGRQLEVELNGNAVTMPENQICYQLIIRDITLTKQMEKQVLESKQLLDTSRQAAIFGMASLAECRDDTTGAHLLRIRAYTRILAMELALSPDPPAVITEHFIEDLCISSMLHDIGKIGIPDAILLKPGRLSEHEFAVIKQHCELGSNALASAERDSESLSFLRLGQEITRYHHERWDGTGYPNRLKGEDIPLAARIVSLVDVYDALTSKRPYKEAFSHEEACRTILSESGHLFDPVVVAAYLRREQEFDLTRQQMQQIEAH